MTIKIDTWKKIDTWHDTWKIQQQNAIKEYKKMYMVQVNKWYIGVQNHVEQYEIIKYFA